MDTKNYYEVIIFQLIIIPFYIQLGWDNFVQSSIQAWNEFYVKWIRHGKRIFFMSYEELENDDKLSNLMERISNFLNFEVNHERIACTIKYKQETFRRDKKCYKYENIEDKDHTKMLVKDSRFSVFSKKHNRWINSAIQNVEKEMKKKSLDYYSILSSYKSTKISVDICN